MNDIDIQQRQAEQDGDAISRAMAAGHCSHCVLTGREPNLLCECGRVFSSYDRASDAIRDAIAGVHEDGPEYS